MREVKALANLKHGGIIQYHQAWLEEPPPGWQEDRDQELPGMPSFTPSPAYSVTEDATTSSATKPSHGWQEKRDPELPGKASFTPSPADNVTEGATTSDATGSVKKDAAPTGQFVPSSAMGLDKYVADHCGVHSSTSWDEKDDCCVINSNLSISQSSQHQAGHNSEVLEINNGGSTKTNSKRPDHLSIQEPGHRNSAPVRSTSQQSKMYLYIQMELCEEESLDKWLWNSRLNWDRQTALDIFHQIVSAVDYIHYTKRMHRHLKV